MATGFSVMDVLNKNSKAGGDESPKARFRTKDISIYKMYRNQMNFYELEAIEELAGEILMYGLKQNLEVAYEPSSDGEYRIIAGERRWLALKMLVEQGYKDFEIATCRLTSPQNEDEEQVEIIIANAYRVKSLKDIIEEEQRLKSCLERMRAQGQKIKGYDLQSGRLRDVISAILNLSTTKIAQIESIQNRLLPELRRMMEKGEITFSAAYELSGMSKEEQEQAIRIYEDTGELSYTQIRDKKEYEKENPVSESDTSAGTGEPIRSVSESDTTSCVSGDGTTAAYGILPVSESDTTSYVSEPIAGDDYETPHPERITSICYSCTEYEGCNLASGTCTKCDQYRNRAEAYKTDEQRYSEEQDAIDRETKRKLREQADEERMNNLPSDTRENGQKVHHIKLGASFFAEVESGEKTFELRKNDRDYKKGDILEMMEFKDGKNTGRIVRVLVTYILTEFTGLEDGYCIMAIKLMEGEDEED